MKLAALVMGLLCLAIAPAMASIPGNPIAASCVPVQPVPVTNCPSSFCQALIELEIDFNQFSQASNTVCKMSNDLLRFAAYPQQWGSQIQSEVNSDLATMTALINKTTGLTYLDGQLQTTLGKIMPGYTAGENFGMYESQLANATRQSIANALATAQVSSSSTSEQGMMNTITTNASQVTSELGAIQMLNQAVGVLSQQIGKEQQLSAAGITAASAYYMHQTQLADANTTTAQAASLSAATVAWNFMQMQFPPASSPQAQSIMKAVMSAGRQGR